MRLPRPLVVGLIAGLIAPVAQASAQRAPKLTRPQRTVLEAVIDAVTLAASGAAPTTPAQFTTHVLRASDGSHYVAVRARTKDAPVPAGSVVLYVRLATRGDAAAVTSIAERSAVKEWLLGERADPLPMRAGGSMSVPRGEMPVGSIIPGGRDVAAESFAALRLLMLEHEKTKKQQEARAAERKAAMERAGGRASPMLPFEDFDVAARPSAAPGGGLELQRSVAAGPGTYELLVGWAEMPSRSAPPEVHVVSHRIDLPPAAPGLGLSEIVVGTRAAALATAYGPDQQNAHPYATGMVEITPAVGNVLRVDDSLALVVQVLNPSAGPTGKPDVSVQFRISRIVGRRDELVGVLPVQRYDASRVPVDFDVAKGHPLFVATRASLTTFARGTYRLTATAQDHVSGQAATAEATFDVRGTPLSLLKEAPRPGRPFQRDAILAPLPLAALVGGITPSAPSAALTALIASAGAGRFADLVRDSAVDPAERATALLLRSLGLYGLGDSARSIAVPLTTALNGGAPEAPSVLLLGAVQAVAGDDAGAVAAWERARARGIADAVVTPLLIDAAVRRGDTGTASRLAEGLLSAQPDEATAARTMVLLHLAADRHDAALRLLDAEPFAGRTDADTRFLVLHALFGGLVTAPAGSDASARRTRFGEMAAAYIAGGGPHAALVAEWGKALDEP